MKRKEDEAQSVYATGILEKWGCTAKQIDIILAQKANTASASEHTDRIGCIVGIDTALRIALSNEDNINGFMTMFNHNPYFEGRRPLDIISTGNYQDLVDTMKHIQSINYL